MTRTIRFHLDEHGPYSVAKGLRRIGIDVSTTHEAGLRRATDEEQLAHCLAEGRVIFTQEDDYLKLHAAQFSHAGIAYCHQHSRSIGEIVRGLTLIWSMMDPSEMAGRVEYL